MVDTMLRIAWDHENGGFCLGGSSFGPDYVEENTVFYEALLNESAVGSGAGCARIVHGLARFQLSKLSTYSAASSTE